MGREIAVQPVRETFDPELRSKMAYFAGQVDRHYKAYGEAWFDLIAVLALAHQELSVAGQHGKFSKWIDEETKMSARTVYRLLSINDLQTNCATVAQLSVEEKCMIEPTAWYELAKVEKPPQRVLTKVVKTVKSNTKVCASAVRDWLKSKPKDHSPPPPPVEEESEPEEDTPPQPTPEATSILEDAHVEVSEETAAQMAEYDETSQVAMAEAAAAGAGDIDKIVATGEVPEIDLNQLFKKKIKGSVETIARVRVNLDDIFEECKRDNGVRKNVMDKLDQCVIEMKKWK